MQVFTDEPDPVVMGNGIDIRWRRSLGALLFALGAAVAVVAGLASPSSATVSDDPTITVSGTVSDWDGTPVADAQVDLFHRAGSGGVERGEFIGLASTDADGNFSFDVIDGCYVFVFIAPDGREFVSGQFHRIGGCVSADDTPPVLDVALSPNDAVRTAAIGGTVTNADGTPASPSRVHLYRAGADGSRSTWLGSVWTSEGAYSFDVTPGCYIFDFAPPEGGRFNRRLWFQTGGCVEAGEVRTDVSAQLDPITNTSISGSVRDDDFRAVGGVQIDLWVECCGQGTRSEYLGSTRTAEDAQYLFRLDEGGCYALVFIAPPGHSFDGGQYAERRTCLETDERVSDLNARTTLDARQSRLSGEVYADFEMTQLHNVRVTRWTTEADGSRGDFIDSQVTGGDEFDRFSFQVAAGCYWLVFEAPEGTTLFGEPFDELTACVEPFAEVTGLDTILDARNGGTYAPATVASTVIQEPDSGVMFAKVPVTLDRVWDRPVAVRWNTEGFVPDDRLTSEFDFTAAEGELQFAPGETVQDIEIEIFGDSREESEEDISVQLLEGRFGDLSRYTSEVQTIIDNGLGTPQAIVIGDGSAYEGEAGTSQLWTLPVSFAHPPEGQFQIQFGWEIRPVAGTEDNQDLGQYQGQSFFATNASQSSIVFQVEGDAEIEPNEQFEAVITFVRGLRRDDLVDLSDTGVFTILNDDDFDPEANGSVSMTDSSISVQEGNFTGWMPFSITVDSPSPIQRSVWLVGHDGTAIEGEDFSTMSDLRILIPAGATQVEHRVRIFADSETEPDETFTIELVNPSPGLSVGDGITEITIIDID
ncbi:MAG: Calx-beta domain-containing protein [Acidimicrobiales bacterium]